MTTRTAAADEPVRVYVWDMPVRITHWLIVFSIVVLSVTGFYIGEPFIVVAGEARNRFVMGYMKLIHYYAAIVFTLSVLARIVWMFVGGAHARWTEFIPTTRERVEGFIGTVRFYLFVQRDPPPFVGHNPVAGAAYTAVFGLYLVMIVTGLALYSVNAHIESPLRSFGFLLPFLGGPQLARWIHHVVMWLLLGFAVHHVYSGLLVSHVEKNATMESIFSGFKFVGRSTLPPSQRPEDASE